MISCHILCVMHLSEERSKIEEKVLLKFMVSMVPYFCSATGINDLLHRFASDPIGQHVAEFGNFSWPNEGLSIG